MAFCEVIGILLMIVTFSINARAVPSSPLTSSSTSNSPPTSQSPSQSSSPMVTSAPTRKSSPATSVPSTGSCAPDTCRNGGVCFHTDDEKRLRCLCKKGYGDERCDVFIGDNAVNISVKIPREEWLVSRFQASIAITLNDYCAKSGCPERSEKAHGSKRSSDERAFSGTDVLVVEKGIGLSDILWVVFAVAERRDSGNSSSVLPAELVSKFVEEKAYEIGKHLRGKVFPRPHIPTDPPKESAPAAPDKTDIGNGAPGQTIGIAVGVVVALLVIVLVFFFWRRQKNVRGRPPLVNNVRNQFSNPGFNDAVVIYASIEENRGRVADGSLFEELSVPQQESQASVEENPGHVAYDSQFEELRFPQQDSNYAKPNYPLSTKNSSPGDGSIQHFDSKISTRSEYQDINKMPGDKDGFASSREYERPRKMRN